MITEQLMTQEQGREIGSILKELVENFLNTHRHLTLNALAQRSSIPLSTLRRIHQGVQKTDLAPHTVLNLVSYVYKEKRISKVLKLVAPELREFLEKNFGSFIFESDERVYSPDLNQILKDPVYYIIYKLAANHEGTTLVDICEIYGSFGKKKADEMIVIGLLKEIDGVLHAKEKNFSLDLEVAAQNLSELIRFFRPKELAQGYNLFYSLSEALTKEAIAEVKNIQREAAKKILSIMENDENKGEIPYFTLNMAESFLSVPHGEIQ